MSVVLANYNTVGFTEGKYLIPLTHQRPPPPLYETLLRHYIYSVLYLVGSNPLLSSVCLPYLVSELWWSLLSPCNINVELYTSFTKWASCVLILNSSMWYIPNLHPDKMDCMLILNSSMWYLIYTQTKWAVWVHKMITCHIYICSKWILSRFSV